MFKLLNPALNRTGLRSVLSTTKHEMLVKTAIYDSKHGRAWSMTDMRVAMGKVALEGRPNGYKNSVPTLPTLRQLRVDNPELTFRNKINKDLAKERGERYEHVKSFETVLEQVRKENQYLSKDPDRVWNMDETGIDCEFWPREEVACSSTSNHSGSRICTQGSGTGVHVTCFVAVSASGLRSPPFFIIQGKHPMSSWTAPITGEAEEKLRVTELERFTREDWFPSEGVKIISKKGSMTMETLPSFMRHFNTYVRKHVNESKKVLLTLYGHSSRKGIAWLEEAVKCNIEVAKAPANTSQFLQPCDQDVKKVIKSKVRRVRDRLIAAGMKNSKSVRFKIVCPLAGMDDLSLNDIRLSFSRTGLWPMDMRFTCALKNSTDRIKDDIMKKGETTRISDSTTTNDCRRICHNERLSPEQQLRELSILLKNREMVNSLLMKLKHSGGESKSRSMIAAYQKALSLRFKPPTQKPHLTNIKKTIVLTKEC